MRSIKFSVISILFISFSTGCAVPLKRDEPVEVESFLWNPSFKQDGESINEGELEDHLREVPGTESAMKRYDQLSTAYLVTFLGSTGIALSGLLIFRRDNDKPNWTLYVAGLSGIVVSGIIQTF